MRNLILVLASLALILASTAAFADADGVQVTIKNTGSSDVQTTITRNGMTESDNPVTKTASAGSTATFTKSETAHDESEKFPLGWKMELLNSSWGQCNYIISLDNHACKVQTGMQSCANVETCGDCCFEFTVKPK